MANAVARSSFDHRAFFAQEARGRRLVTVRTDEAVFIQGEAADAVFYIKFGEVKNSVVSGRGKEAIVSFLHASEFFGEGAIAGQALRISSVHAVTETTLVRLEKGEMIRLLREEPEFSLFFTDHLLKRAMRVESDLIDQLFNSSERRLARLLLILANYGNDGAPKPILAKISQETLAEMIGTTRSRVSFFMNRFRKLGFISYNGHIQVNKSLLNLVLHDPPAHKD
jgi:CRP-like cAMP-binding protein